MPLCLVACITVSLAHLDRFLQVDALRIWIELRLWGADALLEQVTLLSFFLIMSEIFIDINTDWQNIKASIFWY